MGLSSGLKLSESGFSGWKDFQDGGIYSFWVLPQQLNIFCPFEIGTTVKFYYFSEDEQEEHSKLLGVIPRRGSAQVLRRGSAQVWEGWGEILLADPIGRNVLESVPCLNL